jgi:hypothetical protein
MEIFSDGVFAIAIALLGGRLLRPGVPATGVRRLLLVFVVRRSDHSAFEEEPGADIVPPR